MLKNYFIIALRHLRRHKLFSLINILCLAIGITFSMLIGVYVLGEKSVNKKLANINNQYLVKSKWKVKGMGLDITTVAPLVKALKDGYPNLVANYYRFNPVTNVVSAGEQHFKENIAIGDTNLVSMYGLEVAKGNKDKAFANNNSAVITEQLAIKLFGTTDVLNKTIAISNTTSDQQLFSISAVLKKIPYNSVNNLIDNDGYDVFVPFEGNKFYGAGGAGEDNWGNIYIVGLLELKPGVHPADLSAAIDHTLALNMPDAVKGKLEVELAPLKDYYLKSNNGAVQKMITTLSLVALFILLMAIINFININIGTSSYRLKEIGLRKVFGSAKRQLVIQHLAESLVLTSIACMVSLFFYELVRPVFDQLLNTSLLPVWQFRLYQIGLLVLLIIAVGIIAGIYPAFVLSSSRIIHSVKGKIDTAKGGLAFRKSLLVVQFTLAIVIFISALNVSKQVAYFFNKDIGYNKDQLLVITAFPKQWDSAGVARMESIRNELAQTPGVKDASLSFEMPDRTPPNTMDLIPEGGDNQVFVVPTEVADGHFADTYGMKIKEGDFFKDYDGTSAQGKIVLNETAVKSFGWKSGVGKTVKIRGTNFTLLVAGVIKDFNYSSFQQSIGPLAFTHTGDNFIYRYLTVKLATADIARSINTIRDKWKSLSPNAPFEYTFMDQRFNSLYKSELQLKKATRVATILNLIIVFMGIFGVVAFTLARRTKEIAVRKVLGADVKNIILLFIKDYALLILLANIIAWPLAYLATDQWLENYTYRIRQDVVLYIYVGVFIFAAAFVFIALQCLKAATANPVRNLRTE